MKRFPAIAVVLATLVAAAPARAGEGVTWREQSEWIRDARGVAVITVDDARGGFENSNASLSTGLHFMLIVSRR